MLIFPHQRQATGEARIMEGGDPATLPGSFQALVGPRQDLPVQLSICDVPATS